MPRLLCAALAHRDAQRLRTPPRRHARSAMRAPRSAPSGSSRSSCPPATPTPTQRYPVVYLFHGGGQDHTAFMARAIFPALARKQEAIFVMPAADRNYSSLSADGQARYNAYVASELVDYVDANYRTIASPQSRAIAGISMGGRIATMTALQHPQRFGVVGRVQRGAADGCERRGRRRRGIADLLLRLVRHERFAAARQPAVRRCGWPSRSWRTSITRFLAGNTPGMCGTKNCVCSSACLSKRPADVGARQAV